MAISTRACTCLSLGFSADPTILQFHSVTRTNGDGNRGEKHNILIVPPPLQIKTYMYSSFCDTGRGGLLSCNRVFLGTYTYTPSIVIKEREHDLTCHEDSRTACSSPTNVQRFNSEERTCASPTNFLAGDKLKRRRKHEHEDARVRKKQRIKSFTPSPPPPPQKSTPIALPLLSSLLHMPPSPSPSPPQQTYGDGQATITGVPCVSLRDYKWPNVVMLDYNSIECE